MTEANVSSPSLRIVSPFSPMSSSRCSRSIWLLKVSVTPNKLLYSEGIRMWPSRDHVSSTTTFVHETQRIPDLLQEQPDRRRLDGDHRDGACLARRLCDVALHLPWQNTGSSTLMLLTQMFPLVMLVAPIFKMLSPLGLTNSLTGLVIVYTAFNVPFATFLMQSFFDGIPKDLEEAAMIDGATQFVAFRQIILPLTLPGIAATLGFVFYGGLERAAVLADADLRQ